MFELFLVTHIVAGIVCLITGLTAVFLKKRSGGHTRFGIIYFGSYLIVFMTTIAMSILHWESSSYLFYIGIFSFGLAVLGLLARKIRWKGWISAHIGGMLGSYIGIVTATLVVNIDKIPVLRDMPVLLFWFLPTVIGTPVIIRAGQKYRPKKKKKVAV